MSEIFRKTVVIGILLYTICALAYEALTQSISMMLILMVLGVVLWILDYYMCWFFGWLARDARDKTRLRDAKPKLRAVLIVEAIFAAGYWKLLLITHPH